VREGGREGVVEVVGGRGGKVKATSSQDGPLRLSTCARGFHRSAQNTAESRRKEWLLGALDNVCAPRRSCRPLSHVSRV